MSFIRLLSYRRVYYLHALCPLWEARGTDSALASGAAKDDGLPRFMRLLGNNVVSNIPREHRDNVPCSLGDACSRCLALPVASKQNGDRGQTSDGSLERPSNPPSHTSPNALYIHSLNKEWQNPPPLYDATSLYAARSSRPEFVRRSYSEAYMRTSNQSQH